MNLCSEVGQVGGVFARQGRAWLHSVRLGAGVRPGAGASLSGGRHSSWASRLSPVWAVAASSLVATLC